MNMINDNKYNYIERPDGGRFTDIRDGLLSIFFPGEQDGDEWRAPFGLTRARVMRSRGARGGYLSDCAARKPSSGSK